MESQFAIPANRLKANATIKSKVKREFAIPVNPLEANIIIEPEVKTRLRYTVKSLESKYHYRIRDENANSLYQQAA